jgi:hypothetical protein
VNREAIDVTARHERASATPRGEAPLGRSPAAPAKVNGEKGVAADKSLRDTQVWFARAIMQPDSQVQDAHVAARLTAGPRLGATERLEIYQQGYRARLVECLADDYPVLQHALGEERFHELCVLYIERHPSEGPNLNFFGRHMESLCRDEAVAVRSRFRPRSGEAGDVQSSEERIFAAGLAALEWAIVEVIHAPSSDPLTLEGFQDMPPEAWPAARLVPNQALRLLRSDYPVNAYFQEFRNGGDPALPAPGPSSTVVYRSGRTVWRMDLTPPMFDVLSALTRGVPLGEALGLAESSLAGVDPTEAAQRVTFWFREWISSGLFVGVER